MIVSVYAILVKLKLKALREHDHAKYALHKKQLHMYLYGASLRKMHLAARASTTTH